MAVFYKVNLGKLERKVPSVFLPNSILSIYCKYQASLNVARFRSMPPLP